MSYFGNERFNYRTSKVEESLQVEDWMEFFLHIGNFINNQKEGNIIVYFLDNELPSYFISLGTILSVAKKFNSSEEDVLTRNIEHKLKVNQEIIIQDKKNVWRKAQFLNSEERPEFPEKFNPYFNIRKKVSKEPVYNHYLPKTMWFGNIVLLHEESKQKIGYKIPYTSHYNGMSAQFLGERANEMFTILNQPWVNLHGYNLKSNFKDFTENMFIKTKVLQEIKLSSLLFNTESTYFNGNIVFNESKAIKNTLNIYIGENGMRKYSDKGKRNIFLWALKDRFKDNDDLYINNLVSNKNIDGNKYNLEFSDYLTKNNVVVPRGVEYVYFK